MPFPIGTVIAYPGQVSATHNCEAQGWYLCDGRVLAAADYPLLSKVLPSWEAGSGFCLPDYRGMFLRGHDLGAGNDPGAVSRYRPGDPSRIVGDLVGSWQNDALSAHPHHLTGTWGVWPGSDAGIKTYGSNEIHPTDSTGDTTESRPTNVYVDYLILGDVR